MGEFHPQRRFARSPVAHLATVSADGTPHLVPIVFALQQDVQQDLQQEIVYTAIDAKPKTTPRLRRLANIENNPRVSVLVDHYADNWAQLWWVRADGLATIHRNGPEMRLGYELLRAKYRQYESVALNGPVIAVVVQHWASWRA